MEYKVLGKTGLKISKLGFGGIPIQKVDAKATRKLIEVMVEKGINYIDTARGYTVSESYLGEALEGVRDKFILATKTGVCHARKKQWQRILISVLGIFGRNILIFIRCITQACSSWKKLWHQAEHWKR